MTREEHLELCTICKNRKMDYHIGLLCGLTNQLADFEGSCEAFDKDQEAEAAEFIRKVNNTGDHTTGHSYDYKKNKDQGFYIIAAGVLLTVLSFLFSNYTGMYVITIGTILYGIRQYSRGVEQQKIFEKGQEKKER